MKPSVSTPIPRWLSITPKTAETHIERIYAKTGASTRSTATLFAMQHGLKCRRGVLEFNPHIRVLFLNRCGDQLFDLCRVLTWH
jgi:hypothetical protein